MGHESETTVIAKSVSPTAELILQDIGLSEIPTEWTVVRIENLLSPDRPISVGVMYPGGHTENGIPLIKAGDLGGNRINASPDYRISRDKHQEYLRTELSGGELLISLVGDIGRCAVVLPQMKGWNAARAVAVLRFVEPKDAQFVRLCLLSPPLQHLMNSWATTTVQATLNLKEIRQIPLPWPSPGERKAIAAILGALDDKIELNRRMNRTLEAMARALFQSWFVDFDPVHAKAAGLEPGLPPEIAALFPDRLVESELGEIPEGWEVGAIGDIACNIKRTVRPESILPETVYIGLEHMPQKSIALSEWGNASSLESNKYVFKRGEILFGKLRPYFHKVGIAPCDGVCSTDILVVAPTEPFWFSVALGHLSSSPLIDSVNASSTGTKMPRTNWEDVARFKIALPNYSLPDALNDQVLPLTEKIRTNIFESNALAALRDTLLPKLISGELRVPEAEELIEEAVA